MNADDHSSDATFVQADPPRENRQNLQFIGTPGLLAWMREERVSLAISTYRSGKVFFVGVNPQGELSIFERTLSRCMGMWTDRRTLWLATSFQIWVFEDLLAPGQLHEGFDRCYAPRVGYIVGDLNAHDLAVDRTGRIVFVNTQFNCLAAPSDTHSFIPLWKPPFISRLIAEDRCHLNGLALQDGIPRYVSLFAKTDEREGWRKQRLTGGGVIDLRTDEFVVKGLAMPHSPRVYRDRLWLLHSGAGELGYVDRASRTFFAIESCPGYVRGLDFHGDHAVVGMSKGKDDDGFQKLPLQQRLIELGEEPRCGVAVINLQSGRTIGTLFIDGFVTEVYEVRVLPGVTRPMALGFKTNEIERMISIGPAQKLFL
jgi:uncharacterized protein (TIGR03032 family)